MNWPVWKSKLARKTNRNVTDYTHHPAIKAALFDIDGTLTTGGDVWRPLIESPDIPRHRRLWLYGTGFPHYILSKIGLLSQSGFRDRWVRLMAWLVKGWTTEQLHRVTAEIVTDKILANQRPDTLKLLQEHVAQGHHVILVSTMFSVIGQQAAEHWGTERGLGSELEVKNARCTGRIIGETCSGGRKVTFARQYLANLNPPIEAANCVAYADSRSDIPFLEGFGYAVATHPDDAMRTAAVENGWSILES